MLSLFYSMEARYATLATIYDIVKHEFNPTGYTCQPNQIILRQQLPWDSIMNHINDLASEGLVTVIGLGNSIYITDKGIQKLKTPGLITSN